MSEPRKINSALISVFNKDGLALILEELKRLGVTIYSTGGTQKTIEDLGGTVVPVETLTDYPSILGGRVKTLHPKVFGQFLAVVTTKVIENKPHNMLFPTSTLLLLTSTL